METTNNDTVESTYKLRIKFNTNIVFEAVVTDKTSIIDLSKMCILECCKLQHAPLTAVSDELVQKCKLVCRGKIINQQMSSVTSIEGITNPTTQIFCIMPQMTAAEIDSIKRNICTSDEDIMILLSSEKLHNCLSDPKNFAHLSTLLNIDYVVPQSQIDFLLGSEAILNYVKKANNFQQITNWANSGGQLASEEVVSEMFAFQQTLNEVLSMGFPDDEMTREVIMMFKGNIGDVVNHLVSM